MPRALKTFQAHLGFYDTIVAVPSRAAALRAWGSRQDLFRDGLARPSEDAAAIAAACAKPGVVLRRPAGSKAPFSENPGLPQIPKAPQKPVPAKDLTPRPAKEVAPKAAKTPPRKIVKEKKPRPPPSRSAIEAAEKAQGELRREEERVLAALAKRKAALDDEELRIRNAFRARRQKAQAALAQALQAYKDALNRG